MEKLDFKDLCESFYGSTSGNINSPIWICGIEWGGGWDTETPIDATKLQPYSFDALQCCSTDEFEKMFWAPRSPFCQMSLKILRAIKTGKSEKLPQPDTFETLEKEGIVGENGLALILNAYLFSFADKNAAQQDFKKYRIRHPDGTLQLFSDWTECQDVDSYRTRVVALRSNTFTKERKNRAPKIILTMGLKKGGEAKSLFGYEEGNGDRPLSLSDPDGTEIYLLNNPERKSPTVLVNINFPSGSYGFVSFEQITRLCLVTLPNLWKENAKELGDWSEVTKMKKKCAPQKFLNKREKELTKFKDLNCQVNDLICTLIKFSEDLEKNTAGQTLLSEFDKNRAWNFLKVAKENLEMLAEELQKGTPTKKQF